MDSTLDHYSYTYFNTRQVLKRYYSYPNASTTLIQWYGEAGPDGILQLIRSDSVLGPGTRFEAVKSLFNRPINLQLTPATAFASYFQLTNYRNPLAELNIGGLPFAFIYSPVKREILGNPFSKAILNSNTSPIYLDFCSPLIPSSFFLTGFYGDVTSGFPIGSTPDYYDFRVTGDSIATQYPGRLSIGATTALVRYLHEYTYWSKIKK